MKTLKSTLALLALVLFVASCGAKGSTVETSDAKEVASAAEATALAVNVDNSIVTWIGSKPAGKHNGTIDISAGEIKVSGNEIVAGNFVIDITSLKSLDIPADNENNAKLVGHLMSADFFDAATHSTATFEVTSVAVFNAADVAADNEEFKTDFAPAKMSEIMVANPTHMISGNLTMRGTTKNITFPASVSIADGVIKAAANFNINRTDWGLMYGDEASAVDKAKDQFIYNTVNVGFSLEAGTSATM
ncbi:MAG: lipid-binding protein [Cytophagales bacterium CG12_big_fil_rev_8_21_14_0_65_40_12]|nr:MAG: lipid-binding protein [Cytophagales bacterium CG12_big_fil_rev_8_21_14_0_65_40_12]PIW05890.1 MAG: YceI family protein [Cytophagales bacterium CG17_big_fil_post_rev_8_21_14_2_50_40_13]